MGTYLTQTFRENTPTCKAEVRELVIQAGSRRVRACLMTTATTILALLPVLTSTGSLINLATMPPIKYKLRIREPN